MNISKAAEESGLPVKTIRYYEEIGLVAPARGPNGYRAFTEAEVHGLSFVARARDLGFSVEECRRLLALWHDRDRASADVRALAQAHLRRIDTKIADLQALRGTLSHLVEACAGDARPECPIIDTLEADAGVTS